MIQLNQALQYWFVLQLQPGTKEFLSQNVWISNPSWHDIHSAFGALQQSSGLLNTLSAPEIKVICHWNTKLKTVYSNFYNTISIIFYHALPIASWLNRNSLNVFLALQVHNNLIKITKMRQNVDNFMAPDSVKI